MQGREPGADIALHLARHGLAAQVERVVAPEVADGEALLDRAAELSADLHVVGAYGHSRLRELVLGGVTRSTLLRRMTVPVLMPHRAAAFAAGSRGGRYGSPPSSRRAGRRARPRRPPPGG
jgi:nucleotide-binding universal stress UspA family protein